jgi:uncharacterized membrane protein YhiD involved in acid resistance
MNFDDIFKKSFLRSVNTGDISVRSVLLMFLIACIYAAYIFVVYRVVTRKTFYNKSFNISLAAITVIVAAIVLTIQSSIVVSLGMVGALSIVRFRTAIKDPMDLVFLFWAIAIGIICGAGLSGIGIVASLVLTIGILVLDAIPVAKAPLLLVVNANDKGIRDDVLKVINDNTSVFHVKSQTMETNQLAMIVEVRTKDGNALIDGVSKLDGVTRCSLVSHDGEVTF